MSIGISRKSGQCLRAGLEVQKDALLTGSWFSFLDIGAEDASADRLASGSRMFAIFMVVVPGIRSSA